MRSVLILMVSTCLWAQHDMSQMGGMDMSTMPGMSMPAAEPMQASGTSMNPAASPMAMLQAKANQWTLMFHGVVFATDIQQSGPRGIGVVGRHCVEQLLRRGNNILFFRRIGGAQGSRTNQQREGEYTHLPSLLLEQPVDSGLGDSFVNIRFGAAGGDAAQDLAIHQNRQSALVGEELRVRQRLDIALLDALRSVLRGTLVIGGVAGFSLGEL